jgi:glycosyltransferase involved in cell wall biosynthesis
MDDKIRNATLVSVVIPCRNQGCFLAECIESVLAQTYRPLEIVVVDDASTDDTGKVATSFSQVRYIHLTEHLGERTPANALNKGAASAQGQMVMFVGADDKLTPNHLEDCMKAYIAYSDRSKVGFVSTGIQEFGASSAVRLPKVEVLSRWNWYLMDGTVGAILVPKAALSDVGEYDITVAYGEDYDWLVRALDRGWVGVGVKKATYLYRVHSSSLGSQSDALKRQAVRRIMRRHRRMYLIWKVGRFIHRQKYRFNKYVAGRLANPGKK